LRHAPTSFISRLRRAGALALLLYEALFLNVLVPVHTRGAITLNASSGSSCCASHETRSTPKQAPSEKDRQNCAVCNFAARMSTPPVICHQLPELGLAQVLPLPTPDVAVSLERALPYLSRGPPSAA
jgi:hypothetical protein